MNRRRLDYGRMIAEALRDVARQALSHVEREGMPGEHHFFLTFRTGGEGVHVPAFLREQYPGEMTVVLQNQFWDLLVDDEGFSVTLAFGGSRHRVMVPWPQLTAFADPSAQLGLRFEPEEGEGGEGDGEDGDGGGDHEGPAAWAPSRRAGAAEEGGDAGDGGKVVRLDRFRRRDDEEGEAGEDGSEDGDGEAT